jgi:hypothetical protein
MTGWMKLRRPGHGWIVFVVTLVIFVISPVRVPTDSRYSTLVSEALLRHGSVALDPQWFAGELPYQVETIHDHIYSFYPLGGPVLVTPLLGALRLVGLSSVGADGRYDEGHDVIAQALLAALLMALFAALVFHTARAILPAGWSLLVALGAAFGTQIWTTASRALWGDTFLALLFAIVVWLLVRLETHKPPRSPALLATVIAWSFLCRPTAVVAVVAVTAYVALHHRQLLVRYVAIGCSWFAAFVVWSWLTFGTLLPTYYRLSSTIAWRGVAEGLAGLLVSPSRGQLVFVPVTLFVSYLAVRYARGVALRGLRLPLVTVLVGHLLLIALFPTWHGGHSYGPRYLTPLVPWLALLAALGLRASMDARARGRRWELAGGAILLACGVLIHARGAFARETWVWNVVPDNISVHPARVWSVRDAQPLAGLLAPPMPHVIPAYVPGARLEMASPDAGPFLIPGGWSASEGTFRWTDGHRAELVFGLETIEPLMLDLELEPFLLRAPEQRIEIQLNGHAVGDVRITRPGIQTVEVQLPVAAVARENRLTFHLPDAAFASPLGLGRDPRQLAVAVPSLRLRR